MVVGCHDGSRKRYLLENYARNDENIIYSTTTLALNYHIRIQLLVDTDTWTDGQMKCLQ